MAFDIQNRDIVMQLIEETGKSGVLLVSGETPNPMTMGWCTTGIFWSEPVFMAPVRLSRYTHELIKKTGKFTVCLPNADKRAALGFCGSHSGRDCDKLAECGFNAMPTKTLGIPTIDGCSAYVECEVLGAFDMELSGLNKELCGKWYADGDVHTMFYGRITAAYRS